MLFCGVTYITRCYMLTLPLSEGLHLLFCVLYNVVSENHSVQKFPLGGGGSIASSRPKSHTHILTISNGMKMRLPPPCFSVLKMYIQRLNYQVFPMKTSEPIQIWTKCV